MSIEFNREKLPLGCAGQTDSSVLDVPLHRLKTRFRKKLDNKAAGYV